MKELLDQLKGSLTDILNVGRLIFYPFAGTLIVLAFYMIVRLLLDTDPSDSLSIQMLKNLQNITSSSWSVTFILFISSVVTGFLLATIGYPIVIEELGKCMKKEVDDAAPAMWSFSLNYPRLRNKRDEDYAGWLISEYYRYVEIATYIPLGGIIGLLLIDIYILVFLLWEFARLFSLWDLSGLRSPWLIVMPIVFFISLTSILILIKYYVWPQIWVKKVLKPVMRSYMTAKRNLIDSLKEQPPLISGQK